MNSIRRILLIALLSAYAVVMAVAAGATYLRARSEANDMFDYHLRQIALSMRDQAFLGAPLAELLPGDEDFDFVIQVWDTDGASLYLSHPHTALPAQVRIGFSTVETREGSWRVFGVQQRGRTIQASQPMSVRNREAAAVALRTLGPLFILLPAFAALMWLLVGRGLKPLERVARAVSARSPAQLAPIDVARVPQEIQPLVDALNDLLGRLDHAFASQRAFIADAAHELRTPLTALQLQVQLVERARGELERATALADLRQGLQRASHVVHQLLTLARQEPGAAERAFAPVELDQLVRLVVAELLPLAESRRIDLGVTHADLRATVDGDADALRTLTGNLVDNAVRYSPSGGKVDVDLARHGDLVVLQVTDNGPGIPAAERERVFDRFYRSDQAEASGSGLGLAIVDTIAQRHQARIDLDQADGGGLRVRVTFPAAAPSNESH